MRFDDLPTAREYDAQDTDVEENETGRRVRVERRQFDVSTFMGIGTAAEQIVAAVNNLTSSGRVVRVNRIVGEHFLSAANSRPWKVYRSMGLCTGGGNSPRPTPRRLRGQASTVIVLSHAISEGGAVTVINGPNGAPNAGFFVARARTIAGTGGSIEVLFPEQAFELDPGESAWVTTDVDAGSLAATAWTFEELQGIE